MMHTTHATKHEHRTDCTHYEVVAARRARPGLLCLLIVESVLAMGTSRDAGERCVAVGSAKRLT